MFIKLGYFKSGPSAKQIFTIFTVNLVHLVIFSNPVNNNNFLKINNSERNKKESQRL